MIKNVFVPYINLDKVEVSNMYFMSHLIKISTNTIIFHGACFECIPNKIMYIIVLGLVQSPHNMLSFFIGCARRKYPLYLILIHRVLFSITVHVGIKLLT